MLFEKKMEPRCSYCARGERLDEEQVAGSKKGIMPAGGHCRAFRCDPLKRVPPKPAALEFGRLREEDFTL